MTFKTRLRKVRFFARLTARFFRDLPALLELRLRLGIELDQFVNSAGELPNVVFLGKHVLESFDR